jgi:hypothetical protein
MKEFFRYISLISAWIIVVAFIIMVCALFVFAGIEIVHTIRTIHSGVMEWLKVLAIVAAGIIAVIIIRWAFKKVF